MGNRRYSYIYIYIYIYIYKAMGGECNTCTCGARPRSTKGLARPAQTRRRRKLTNSGQVNLTNLNKNSDISQP